MLKLVSNRAATKEDEERERIVLAVKYTTWHPIYLSILVSVFYQDEERPANMRWISKRWKTRMQTVVNAFAHLKSNGILREVGRGRYNQKIHQIALYSNWPKTLPDPRKKIE